MLSTKYQKNSEKACYNFLEPQKQYKIKSSLFWFVQPNITKKIKICLRWLYSQYCNTTPSILGPSYWINKHSLTGGKKWKKPHEQQRRDPLRSRSSLLSCSTLRNKTKGLSEHTQCPCCQLPQMPRWCVFRSWTRSLKMSLYVEIVSKQHLTPIAASTTFSNDCRPALTQPWCVCALYVYSHVVFLTCVCCFMLVCGLWIVLLCIVSHFFMLDCVVPWCCVARTLLGCSE